MLVSLKCPLCICNLRRDSLWSNTWKATEKENSPVTFSVEICFDGHLPLYFTTTPPSLGSNKNILFNIIPFCKHTHSLTNKLFPDNIFFISLFVGSYHFLFLNFSIFAHLEWLMFWLAINVVVASTLSSKKPQGQNFKIKLSQAHQFQFGLSIAIIKNFNHQ